MFKRALRLAKLFLFSPSRAAEACHNEENLAPCFWIYVVYISAYMIFFTLKPFDFPDQNAPYPREPQSLMFWFKVMLWQPPLEAAWIAFVVGLAAWFRQGRLPLRMVAAVAWAATPYILFVAYKGSMPKWALAAGSLVWIGLFVPLWRRTKRAEFNSLLSFMLGINAVGIPILAPMSLALWRRSSDLFMASQAVGGFWMLGCATLGLRRLTGLRMPRAFMVILLSIFFQAAIAFTLHLLGIVPKEILKAILLYA